MADSYLLSICDMRVNYYGCQNADELRKFDFIIFWFHSATLCCCLGVLVTRIARSIRSGLKIRQGLTSVDALCFLASLFHIFRICLFLNLRHNAIPPETADGIANVIRLNIYFEFLAWSIGSLTISVFTLSVVKAVTNTNLMGPILIRGVKVDAEKAIGVLRIVLMLMYLVYFSFWAYADTLEKYITFRRISFLSLGLVCIFVSAPILAFFGFRVISTLRQSQGKSMMSRRSQVHSVKAANLNDDAPAPRTTVNGMAYLREKALQQFHRRPVMRTASRIRIMTYFIQVMVWAVYVNLGILCITYTIISELYPHDDRVIAITKVILDYYLWINGTHYIIYLFTKGNDN